MGALRTLVVGCGAVARGLHLPIVQDLARTQLVGTVDRTLASAQEAARPFGNVPAFDDFDAAIAATNPELCLVLTPPESHRDLAERAMVAGAHVLIEKPFVYTMAEAQAVAAVSARTGKTFSVIQNDAFLPGYLELRRRIGEGEAGTPCTVEFVSGIRNQTFIPHPWYLQTYGGRLGETLPHALFPLVELLGPLRVAYVSARKLGHTILPESIDPSLLDHDELFVELETPDGGTVARISYSLNRPFPDAFIVSGTKDTLLGYVHGETQPLRAESPGLRQMVRDMRHWKTAFGNKLRGQPRPLDRLRASGHYRQIEAFVADVADGRPHRVSAELLLETVRLWSTIVERYAGRADPPDARTPAPQNPTAPPPVAPAHDGGGMRS